jgi:2-(1,2-epoxy-1,2-dihydrophenyl)acetyl-CoA isomerase
MGDARTVDTGTQDLLARSEDGVLVMTLNRPERRNAMSGPMMEALGTLLRRAAREREIRALVLTGAGKAFCAGGDVRGMNERNAETRASGGGAGAGPSFEEGVAELRTGQAAVTAAIFELPKPVVAAIPGAVAGAGMGLALACDLRIAAESAFLVTAFANVGFSGDYGGSWLLTRLVGPARARELYYLSERVDAKQCEQLGIVNRVVADAALQDEALSLARRLARGPSVAFRYMKENLNRALVADLRTALDAEALGMRLTGQTEDHRSAVRAFVEKRTPEFKGR